MGRAPQPGGPQRVSAHVVPKAKPFSEGDPEDRTTLESQWEEEASTTIEQGEVHDRIRALGPNSITPGVVSSIPGLEPARRPITGMSSSVDEPTVDDQHANPAISQLTPPSSALGRLVITQGNDPGRDAEIR